MKRNHLFNWIGVLFVLILHSNCQKNDEIKNPPIADFITLKSSISVGDTIFFTDLSTNTPTSWVWDFGDGETSTIQNPSHKYLNEGTYTVSLTATNKDGSYTEIKNKYISVFKYGSLTDIDGNTYKTIQIGTQIWMAENLKTTKYNDGTDIPYITDSSEWVNLTTPGYCWYNNETTNKKNYGALYNYYAVNTGKLAPAGWHVSTNAEWRTLTDFLDGERVAGGLLKEEGFDHWQEPNFCATNESGFTALPGGCANLGSFEEPGDMGFWWTDSASEPWGIWFRALFFDASFVYISTANENNGFSVRCVKD